ncbi:MAG: protein translocase subunit SecD [Candidatus Gastranaerophilales bacterium]|nr:protein translocase subunit SecD [Candidatus Gastranaerophilales bacterium]
MKNKIIMFWAIVILTIISIVIIKVKPIPLGLDLVGGSRIVLEAQTTDTIPKITQDMMDGLKTALESRVNALGVSETMVQQMGEKRLLIEIPNISDPKLAREFLGETAELEFKKPVLNEDGDVINWEPSGLSGEDLNKAAVGTDNAGRWLITLEFSGKGANKFAKLTREFKGYPIAIYFNGDSISEPVVQQEINGGHAQITGEFTHDQAKKIVDLLNAGALPVPAKIIEENTVGPTLGADSLDKSKTAGIIGLSLVMIYMILFYRVPGLIADISLIIYSLILFAIFKTVPVTLTLAGIAGFILSIGMAVDANILIFERTKEELKSGRTLFTAINSGFDRAFTSIFDSNMSTIIICAILYFLSSNIVKGFALTLAIGVMVSMFSAITVTKNFMHLTFGTGQLKHPELFGLKESDINDAYEAAETKREKAKFGVLD